MKKTQTRHSLAATLTIIISLAAVMFWNSKSSAADFSYVNDQQSLEVADRVAKRIIDASKLKIPYRCYIENSSQMNAFAYENGTILITRQLLLSIETEEELAAAIAHEMGHLIIHRRAGRSERQFTMVSDDESAADKVGIQLLARANINPASLATVLRRILQYDEKLSRSLIRQLEARIHEIEKESACYCPCACRG